MFPVCAGMGRHRGNPYHTRGVFSVDAGMGRTQALQQPVALRLLRECGDGLNTRLSASVRMLFSPCVWGWAGA